MLHPFWKYIIQKQCTYTCRQQFCNLEAKVGVKENNGNNIFQKFND